MLQFFRKYQQYFYVLITVVIVVSFSFFGTYSTLPTQVAEDPVAFKAVNGADVKRSEVEALTLFISSDSDDKLLFGGIWGPNFLNDGVIVKDFLATGLAKELIKTYSTPLESDWQKRLEKEKKTTLYTHPEAKFISTAAAWEYFIPQKKTHYYKLIQAQNPLEDEAIDSRISLYIDERRFPAHSLRQMLKYQEQQFSWVKPDPSLDRSDFFLFGYHTLDDWFGSHFLRLVSEFIINSAKIAEQRGYKVSDSEVLADLTQHAENSFRQNMNNIQLGVANSRDYMNEQLRRFGMDRRQAVKSWRQVMLFRRLFHDVGNSVLLSPFTFEEFNSYANETVKGELYQLPDTLHIGSFNDLQKLQVYINAVSKQNERDLLSLPTFSYSVFEVEKKYPELVEKRYVLEVAEVDKKNLQNKISVKEMWDWQVSEANWKIMTKEFPDLGVKSAKTEDDRFLVLDQLDDRLRNRINNFSRAQIVDAHPEWIEQALEEAEMKRMDVALSKKGGKTPFKGLSKREEFIRLLDLAPLGEQSDKLAKYSANNQTYYRINVLERSKGLQVMTFAEANQKGILDKLVETELKKYHKANPELFPQEFAETKENVAKEYFAPILKAIRQDCKHLSMPTDDLTATFRFQKHLRQVEEKLQKNLEAEKDWILSENESPTLKDQWKLEKKEFSIGRGSGKETFNKEEAFAMEPGSWSTVNTLPNGDLYFYIVKEKVEGSVEALSEKMTKAHQLLSNDAKQMLMKELLGTMKEKHAISLSYLDVRYDDKQMDD